MAKYYISTGGLEAIIVDDDPVDAMRRALWQNDQEDFPELWGVICKISETGFDSENDQDLYVATTPILDELGIEYEMDENVQEIMDDIEDKVKDKDSFDEEDEEELI